MCHARRRSPANDMDTLAPTGSFPSSLSAIRIPNVTKHRRVSLDDPLFEFRRFFNLDVPVSTRLRRKLVEYALKVPRIYVPPQCPSHRLDGIVRCEVMMLSDGFDFFNEGSTVTERKRFFRDVPILHENRTGHTREHTGEIQPLVGGQTPPKHLKYRIKRCVGVVVRHQAHFFFGIVK